MKKIIIRDVKSTAKNLSLRFRYLKLFGLIITTKKWLSNVEINIGESIVTEIGKIEVE